MPTRLTSNWAVGLLLGPIARLLFTSVPRRCDNSLVDRPMPRWVPNRLRPWLSRRWVQALLVVAVFALLAVVFMLASERKDSSYWAGYADGQRWENKLVRKYRLAAIPGNFLIDASGKIIARDLNGDELNAAVAKALGK